MNDTIAAKEIALTDVPVLQCFNHYMHTVSEQLKKADLNSGCYNFLLGVMRTVGSSINYKHALYVIWYNLYKVIISEYENDEVKRAIIILDKIIEECERYYLQNNNLKHFETEKNMSHNVIAPPDLIKMSLKDRLYKQSLGLSECS